MDRTKCSACQGKLKNCGNIPHGLYLKCTHCGSKKIFIDNYDLNQDHTDYGIAYREKLNITKNLRITNLFQTKFVNLNSSYDLLDIGFGDGEFLLTMKKRGLIVKGLECDINSVNLLRKRGIESYQGELGKDLYINQQFDMITLWDVLEHIDNIEQALAQINSLTKIDGKIIILTPNADSIFDLLASVERSSTFHKSQRIISICLNKYHLHRFSVKGLQILFERFGFKVDHFETLQLFSLNSQVYTDGFAPGILKWTNNSAFNKLISNMAMNVIRMLKIKNKILFSAVKI